MANSQIGTSRFSETRFSLLEQRVGGIEDAVHDLTTKIDTWMSTRNANPWRVIALLLGILVPLGFILNLYITSAISPLSALANQANTKADGNSATMSRLSESFATAQAKFSASESARLSNERE